jgi:hypothetical protein
MTPVYTKVVIRIIHFTDLQASPDRLCFAQSISDAYALILSEYCKVAEFVPDVLPSQADWAEANLAGHFHL